MKVKVEVEGSGFPLKIIIGYLLSSFSVGSIGKRGSLTIVLLLRRAVNTEGAGGQLPRFLADQYTLDQLTLFQPGEQLMPTALKS